MRFGTQTDAAQKGVSHLAFTTNETKTKTTHEMASHGASLAAYLSFQRRVHRYLKRHRIRRHQPTKQHTKTTKKTARNVVTCTTYLTFQRRVHRCLECRRIRRHQLLGGVEWHVSGVVTAAVRIVTRRL
jgi:hypothetical protein